MERNFKDCYISFKDNLFVIGNEKIERQIKLIDNMPVSLMVKGENTLWGSGNTAMFNIADFDFKNAKVSVEGYVSDFGGESEEALIGEIIYDTVDTKIKQVFYVFPSVGAVSCKLYIKGKVTAIEEVETEKNTAIESLDEDGNILAKLPRAGAVDSVNMKKSHARIKAIRLYDETDRYNELVCVDERIMYGRHTEFYNGNMFIITDFINDEAILIVSEGYVSGKKFTGDKDLAINHKKCASVFGNGVDSDCEEYTYVGGTTITLGKESNVCLFYKDYYRKMYKTEEMYIMSNTWGDRNRDTAVCEEFILKEIDVASTLGVDIVQIDDGWQKGASANSGFVKNGAWGNFYETDSNFWDINKDKFPRGFSVITDYAKEKGIRLGLWFSMDKANGYESFKKDALTILKLHKDYGVCYFKIDGLVISDHKCEENIFKFVTFLDKESGGKIKFNFDITANRRYGYFMAKQYSTLFVENRYTDWQNYYPHSTLRNIWSLASYVPAQKMQFEVLNQLRNDEKYGDDILKPSTYPSDYLFASVMVANPLIWMEMSSLLPSQVEDLSKIIKVYKKERDAILKGDVCPIGERPCGFSHTGFDVKCENGGYLILLKEKSDANEFTYEISESIKDYEILLTNCKDAEIEVNGDKVTIKGMEKAGYLFIKY